MNDFRDSLAADVMLGMDHAALVTRVEQEVMVANTILLSPELQAIKSAFRELSKVKVTSTSTPAMDQRTFLLCAGLPQSVVDWVLS